MTSHSRRRAVRSIAALALAPALLPRPARANNGRVVVAGGGGDALASSKVLIVPTMSRLGIDVINDVGTADAHKTKMMVERIARHGSLDVVALSDVDMYSMSRLNVLSKISSANVPNINGILPEFRNEYSVPGNYSALVVLYNPLRLSKPPTSYAEFFSKHYAGQVGLSNLLYIHIIAAASIAATGRVDGAPAAEARLMDFKETGVKVYPSNEALVAAFQSGEISVTLMWLARGYFWKRAGVSIAHVVPEEGAIPFGSRYCIPRNAPDKGNAFAYLNVGLDPRTQIGVAQRMGYVPSVESAPLPLELNRLIGFTDEQRSRFRHIDYEYYFQHSALFLEFWNRRFTSAN